MYVVTSLCCDTTICILCTCTCNCTCNCTSCLHVHVQLYIPTLIFSIIMSLQAPIKRRKQLLTIRDELQHLRGTTPDSSPSDHTPLGSSPPFNVHYISSVYLAQSSLSSDVSQYDFTYATTHSTGSDDIPATGTDDVKVNIHYVQQFNDYVTRTRVHVHVCVRVHVYFGQNMHGTRLHV